jgi:ABC-2 type transport system ATP-binding protein
VPRQPAGDCYPGARAAQSYGKQIVLDGVDFDVEGLFCCSGQTVPARHHRQHLPPFSGADDGGAWPRPRRGAECDCSLIGVTGQVSAVDGQFTGEENLRLMTNLCHLDRDEAAGGSQRCSSVLTWWKRRPSPR